MNVDAKPLVFRSPILPILIVFHSCAITSSMFRLLYRARFRQLWWDDCWAFLALLNIIFLFAGYIQAAFDLPPAWLSSFPVVMVSARLTLWCSRTSVAVTIVRVVATGRSQLISKIVATIFCLIGITVIVQKAILCSPPGPHFTCKDISVITGYTDLATSFFADIWLLTAPSYLLWKMKLKKQVYHLLQAIFATEILLLTTSIVQCIYIQKNDVIAQGVISHFKCTISLIVCNLLFLVTYIYRQIRTGQESSEDSTTSAPSRRSSSNSYLRKSYKMISIGSTIQALTTVLTGTFSSRSGSQRSTINGPSGSIFESEPGIIERQWPSVNASRDISTV